MKLAQFESQTLVKRPARPLQNEATLMGHSGAKLGLGTHCLTIRFLEHDPATFTPPVPPSIVVLCKQRAASPVVFFALRGW